MRGWFVASDSRCSEGGGGKGGWVGGWVVWMKGGWVDGWVGGWVDGLFSFSLLFFPYPPTHPPTFPYRTVRSSSSFFLLFSSSFLLRLSFPTHSPHAVLLLLLPPLTERERQVSPPTHPPTHPRMDLIPPPPLQ